MDTACAARVHCCLAAAPRGFTQRRRSRRAPLVHAQQQSQGTDEQGAGNDSAPQQQPPTGPPAAASQPPPLTDPAGMVVYGGKLPPARRLVVSGLTATAIAVGGNLFGVTSWLLGLDGGELAARSRLDVLVPVDGFRRCLDRDNGFTFQYPSRWLADQTLYRRYAQRVEQAAALDPPPLRGGSRRNGGAPEPAAAYGPPGGSGEENISVVVAPIRDGFTLRKMGGPEEAALRFLETTVAPEGSGKTATLLGAGERRDSAGELYYFTEFTVQSERPAFYRHNLAVYAARNGLLYSLNCQSSEARWQENKAGFRRAAESFTILNSGAATAGFPDRL